MPIVSSVALCRDRLRLLCSSGEARGFTPPEREQELLAHPAGKYHSGRLNHTAVRYVFRAG